MSLHAVYENPIYVVRMILKIVSRCQILLAVIAWFERSTKTQARNGAVDEHNRLIPAQFFVEVQGVPIKIIDSEIKNGLTDLITIAHVQHLPVKYQVVHRRGV